MRTKFTHRLLAVALAVCTILGLVPLASAASIADGSKTATIAHTENISILPTNRGNILKAAGYTYTTNDGLSGPAYCIDYGLSNTTKTLPITGKYSSHPAAAGVFANGYPQHSLELFSELYLASNPILSGLTEEEYRYATQIAVWASLGQLGVEGTAFTAGRATVPQPSGDLRQMRVFRAVQLILQAASTWDRIYYTGMYIRTEQDKLGGNISIPANMTLESAAMQGLYGLKLETINGRNYYTREYIFASATSAYYNDYTLDVWAENAPAGTIFVDTANLELSRSRWDEIQTWRLPVEEVKTSLNANGFEYSGVAKLCIPADNVPPSGEITLRCAAQIMQYQIHLAYNETASQQSYIIADPSKGSTTTNAALAWGSEITERGTLIVTKVGGGGQTLEGAKFTLTGTDGSSHTGTTDKSGEILWQNLDPKTRYTLTEIEAPAGYSLTEPQNITIAASRITYVTVQDDTQHTLTVRKVDKQSGYSLRGAVIAFEQIDGSFNTTRTTDHAGIIQMDAEQLPIGSYKVYEKVAPDGYQLDKSEQTVHWSGKQDMTLTFADTRKPTLIISKRDGRTGYSLDGAVFDVFKDGAKVTTVTSGADGCAYVHDISSRYYEVREVSAPDGYVADGKLHGVKVDLYDPATADDPMIVIENDPLPSLLIRKYDRSTLKPIEGVTFKVYRDTELVGSYTTGRDGEILLERVPAGTYTVEEVAAPDSHVVNSTPQSVELKAGQTEPVSLVFFNDLKPGIHLVKVDSKTLKPLANAVFRISKVGGTFTKEYTTDRSGEIDLPKLDTGAYQVVETSAPEGYLIDGSTRTIQINANENAQFVFTNTRKPSLVVAKYDPNSGKYLAGASFRISKIADGSHYLDRVTDTHGRISIGGLDEGVYSVVELAAPEGYIRRDTEYHVELFAGKTSELVVPNDRKPSLRIVKTDAVSGGPVAGVTFTVRKADSSTISTVSTDEDGVAELVNLDCGVYEVTEKSVPSGYLPDSKPQTITLEENRTGIVHFRNYPKPALTICKIDAITKNPIEGAKFHIAYASNNTFSGEINDLGSYTTDKDGLIELSGLRDGWYRITETEPAAGYALGDNPTRDVFIEAGASKTVTVENQPLGALVIVKRDSETHKPLAGATFRVIKSSGELVANYGGAVSSNGLYATDASGQIIIVGLEPDTYVVTEVTAPRGYELTSAPQTVKLTANDTQTLTFYDERIPEGSLRITKLDEETRQPISGVQFRVTEINGRYVGTYRTNSRGTIILNGLNPGWYTVTETEAADGYALDAEPRDIEVRNGETAVLEVTNRRQSSIVIRKVDSMSGLPLSGAVFVLYDSRENPIGEYRSDQRGYVYIDGLEDGRYQLREIIAPQGYVLDNNRKTVYVRYGASSEIRWENTPVTAQIQIVKRSVDYNASNGQPAGSLLGGAAFEIYDERTGNKVDTIETGTNGLAVSRRLPLGRYLVREAKAPDGYLINNKTMTAVLEYSGQIVRLEVADESVRTGISITKRGPKEAVSGQPIRYVFGDIANASNVSLDSFYWRDTLPSAVTLDRVVTGTYSGAGSYKVMYRVNGGDYRLLADNLSASQEHTLLATPAALGLAADERVTEVMFVFGTVQAGFKQVEPPMLYCTALNGLVANSEIVNVADVGGVYGGKWVQSVARWTTKVYGKPAPLPRTGY